MRIGSTSNNITYEIKIKSIPGPNDTNLDALLETIEKTPKIFSNINGYQDTLDQIEAKANQLNFSHRITSIRSYGITALQIAGYVALGLLGIYVGNKIGLFKCIKDCIPDKLCIHLLCCKTKNNTQIVNTANPIPSTPINFYAEIASSESPPDLRMEPKQVTFEQGRARFHRSILKRK